MLRRSISVLARASAPAPAAAASITPAEGFTLGAAVYCSPEFFLETGDALY